MEQDEFWPTAMEHTLDVILKSHMARYSIMKSYIIIFHEIIF